ncbi:Regulator of microtubule dynamics protein 1 [Pteropus alecto]|uniref:Regulator of microtubule dynamics protein 1 n=1 Tax=Pteropus alecto TaxID=9402 RepID=L5JVD2_PTEAL|nr:Regulator of microtubule dynamics protein 1 [Pteropus alecto]
MGNPGAFKRSLIFSALSYLGFETYQVISRTAVVHATAKVLGVEEVLAQADYLYESGETEKLYQLLTQYKDSEDAELLWRLARVSRDVAQLSRTSEAERKLLVYEALEYAKRALEKNEASFAAHKWYAICISDVGDYEGIKAKIANAYVIKEHFETRKLVAGRIMAGFAGEQPLAGPPVRKPQRAPRRSGPRHWLPCTYSRV